MSVQNAPDKPTTGAVPPKPKSGIRAALEFTGIPPSWFDKRPKLPSRNWLIFLSVTTSAISYYVYDRQECKQIRKSYVDRVKHLAEEPLGPFDRARKVTVYGCKWPGDEDYDRSLKYFRRYVKPILVAAAVDFEMINGRRQGDLSQKVADEIKLRRRIEAGLERPVQPPMPLPGTMSPEEKRQHELDGGIIIVGRPAFKEFMTGLKRGWTEGSQTIDREEQLANILASDGRFDEPEEPDLSTNDVDDEPLPTSSPLPSSRQISPFSALQLPIPSKTARPARVVAGFPVTQEPPPIVIPQLPPLLFVPFTNYVGFRQIPHMLWGFFNEREKVRTGSEAAYRLIMKHSRPLVGPQPSDEYSDSASFTANSETSHPPSDLDFDKQAEPYYQRSVLSIPTEIEKARKSYYDALPGKLEIARALARRIREPTKEETNHPPPTEVELREERFKKELRWTGDLEGCEILKPDQPVAWDDRFNDALHVFVDPPPETKDDLLSESIHDTL